MELKDMSKDERSLLLYFETCAVDHTGLVHHLKMNAADRVIANRWAQTGLIEMGRVCFGDIATVKASMWVRLTPAMQDLAAQERKARAERGWSAREWRTTAEYRGGVLPSGENEVTYD